MTDRVEAFPIFPVVEDESLVVYHDKAIWGLFYYHDGNTFRLKVRPTADYLYRELVDMNHIRRILGYRDPYWCTNPPVWVTGIWCDGLCLGKEH